MKNKREKKKEIIYENCMYELITYFNMSSDRVKRHDKIIRRQFLSIINDTHLIIFTKHFFFFIHTTITRFINFKKKSLTIIEIEENTALC